MKLQLTPRKLGYGGTKSEMERLIADANEYAEANGLAADLSIDSFSDIVTAIDYVQQKQKIAGTTAREAGSTISGSVMMVKAAWQNLITGFADPEADISALAKNVMDSVGIAASNVVPAIMQAIDGIGIALTEALPAVLEQIPTIIDTMATPLLDTGVQLVMSLINGLVSAAPSIVKAATAIIANLANTLEAAAPQLLASAGDIIAQLLLGLAEQLPNLITAGLNLIAALLEGFTQGEVNIMDKIGEIIKVLLKAFIDAAPEMARAALRLARALTDSFLRVNWISLGLRAFRGILSGIRNVGPSIVSYVKGVVNDVLTDLGFTGAAEKARAAFESIKTAISDKIEEAKQKVSDVIETIKGFFPFSIGKLFSFSVPDISIGSQSSSVGGKTATAPKFDVGWKFFQKAMNVPYMFRKPTIFSVAGDSYGDEMMYGKSNLMRDMRQAVKDENAGVINIYLNYDASTEATEMVHDIARGVRRYKMAGVI